jgi:hypothetical protein
VRASSRRRGFFKAPSARSLRIAFEDLVDVILADDRHRSKQSNIWFDRETSGSAVLTEFSTAKFVAFIILTRSRRPLQKKWKICHGKRSTKKTNMEAKMTPPIENSAKCTRCGEELAAPAWSGHVSVEEVREFWCCSKCGYMFETLTPIPANLKLQPELIEAFLPNLLVA